jgi:hypothetical protein
MKSRDHHIFSKLTIARPYSTIVSLNQNLIYLQSGLAIQKGNASHKVGPPRRLFLVFLKSDDGIITSVASVQQVEGKKSGPFRRRWLGLDRLDCRSYGVHNYGSGNMQQEG